MKKIFIEVILYFYNGVKKYGGIFSVLYFIASIIYSMYKFKLGYGIDLEMIYKDIFISLLLRLLKFKEDGLYVLILFLRVTIYGLIIFFIFFIKISSYKIGVISTFNFIVGLLSMFFIIIMLFVILLVFSDEFLKNVYGLDLDCKLKVRLEGIKNRFKRIKLIK